MTDKEKALAAVRRAKDEARSLKDETDRLAKDAQYSIDLCKATEDCLVLIPGEGIQKHNWNALEKSFTSHASITTQNIPTLKDVSSVILTSSCTDPFPNVVEPTIVAFPYSRNAPASISEADAEPPFTRITNSRLSLKIL